MLGDAGDGLVAKVSTVEHNFSSQTRTLHKYRESLKGSSQVVRICGGRIAFS